MNWDKDINHVRALLGRFYRAENTPEEERWLEKLFNETDPYDIPDEIKADAKLFCILSEAHPPITDCDIPENLMEKLNAIVEKPDTHPSPRKEKRIFKILKYSGIAAAACITWAVTTLLPSPRHNESTMPGNHFAEVMDTNDGILKITKSTADNNSFNETTRERPSLPETAQERHVSSTNAKAPQQTETEDGDGFIEITDPEEAKKIAIEIGRLLAFNADKTNDAISHISNSIDSYKEITKTILQ